MHKLLRGACVAVGLVCFGASYYLYNNFTNPPPITEVKDYNYHVENTDDGSGTVKLVMLKGKVTPSDELLEDSKTGVKTKYPVLERKVEMYQYFLKDDKPMMGWKDTPIKAFKDKNGKEWKNPNFPKDLRSNTFYHDFHINKGNLPVSFGFLKKGLDKKKYAKSFYYLKNLPKETTLKGYQWKGSHYLSPSGYKNHIGDIRVYYKVLNHEELPELTIIGQQKNHKVNFSNRDCRFYDEAIAMDEIRKTYKDDAPHAASAALFFGLFFVMLGIFKGER